MKGIPAVGDCNTFDVERCHGNSYPEKQAQLPCQLTSLFDDFLLHFSALYLDKGQPHDRGYHYFADKILNYIKDNQLTS